MSVSTATPLWPQVCCHSADEGSLRSWADQVQTERGKGVTGGCISGGYANSRMEDKDGDRSRGGVFKEGGEKGTPVSLLAL